MSASRDDATYMKRSGIPVVAHSANASRTAAGNPACAPPIVADESIQIRSGWLTPWSGQRSMVESRSARSRSMYVPGALDMISLSVACVRDATRIDAGESVPPKIPSCADDGYVAQLTMPATATKAATTASARPGLGGVLRNRIVETTGEGRKDFRRRDVRLRGKTCGDL